MCICVFTNKTTFRTKQIHIRRCAKGHLCICVSVYSPTKSQLYGSLPDAAIWWCLWTGGGGVLTRTAGYGLGFPATLFLSTILRALHNLMCGGGFSPTTRLRATSRNILWSTTKVNEACARPPHVA